MWGVSSFSFSAAIAFKTSSYLVSCVVASSLSRIRAFAPWGITLKDRRPSYLPFGIARLQPRQVVDALGERPVRQWLAYDGPPSTMWERAPPEG